MRGNGEVGGGGGGVGFGSVGWSIQFREQLYMILEALSRQFMVWLLTHPPLPSACVSPPFWNQRWGGGNTRMRVNGGSQFGRLERKPGTLFTLPVSSKLLIRHHQSINHQ